MRLVRVVTPQQIRPGSEWLEAVITAGIRGYGGPPHGHPSRWDWGRMASSLALAQQKHDRLYRIVREMTPDQRELLWCDTSPVAEEMRRIASKVGQA